VNTAGIVKKLKGKQMGFEWANENSRTFFERGYFDCSVEERVRQIADAAEKSLEHKGFADKFYYYMSQGFYSLASPVWANYGHGTALPISCNGQLVGDSVSSIMEKVAEVGMQTKNGAGTSGYFGNIRPRNSTISSGGKADGAVHYMNLWESAVDIVSQNTIRRGSFSPWYPVEGDDIEEFLEIREEGSTIQRLNPGVTVTNQWMSDMIDGKSENRKIWARVIRKRNETGYPYIMYSDTVNNNKPQVLKDLNIPIWASNLCSEICLPSSDDESFVCDLMSMNILKYDEWKNTDAVKVAIWFLDAVMEEYIEKTEEIPFMESSRKFAMRWRALGLGQLGWHSYLQSQMIPFESFKAHILTGEVSKFIQEQSYEASRELAVEYGEPSGLIGYGMRNLTLNAIAPTTSSSFALGQVSPSIEPEQSNYYTKDLAKGKFTYRNPYLADVITDHLVLGTTDMTHDEIWNSILMKGGSVQHLSFLSGLEKEVFKTFSEISPLVVIQQAAERQKYIDQSQSLNLMIPPSTPAKEVNALMIEAWKLGIKTLYYQRSSNPAQQLVRDIMDCEACSA